MAGGNPALGGVFVPPNQEELLRRLQSTNTYQALAGLGNALMAPGKAWQGALTPDEEIAAGVNIGLSGLAGGALSAPAANELRVFVGPEMGKAMEHYVHPAYNYGRSPESNLYANPWIANRFGEFAATNPSLTTTQRFRHSSGWFVDPEGNLKREIHDLGAELTPANRSGTMAELEHPQIDLHKEYGIPPIQVEDPFVMGLKYGSGTLGVLDPETGEITVNAGQGPRMASTALHETQHAIQEAENWPRGGSPNQFRGSSVVENTVNEMINALLADSPEMARWYLEHGPRRDYYNNVAEHLHYTALPGEAEARNVQLRRAKGYLYGLSPLETFDTERLHEEILNKLLWGQ